MTGGCQGLSWVLGNKEAAGDQKTPGSHRGSLKKRSICSLWKEHMGLRGPARGPQEKGRTRNSLVSRRKERYGVTWVSRASQEAEEKVGALQTICRGLTKVWPHPKHYRVPETGQRATVSQTDRQRSQQGHSETGKQNGWASLPGAVSCVWLCVYVYTNLPATCPTPRCP